MGLLPRQLWLLPRLGNHEIFCYHVLPPIFKPHLPFNGPTGKSNQGKEWIFTKFSLHSKTEILHYSFCKLKPGLWSFEVRELSAILRRSNARYYVSSPPVKVKYIYINCVSCFNAGHIFVICTVCASRKVVCHFCGTIGCWVTNNWVVGR